jgi:hypothetical protein
MERVFEWYVYLSGTCILGNVQQTCNLVNVYFRKHVCYGACRFVERVFEWNVYCRKRVFDWNVHSRERVYIRERAANVYAGERVS